MGKNMFSMSGKSLNFNDFSGRSGNFSICEVHSHAIAIFWNYVCSKADLVQNAILYV